MEQIHKNNKIIQKIKNIIIERKYFKQILPILEKINFYNVAYSYKKQPYEKDILSVSDIPTMQISISKQLDIYTQREVDIRIEYEPIPDKSYFLYLNDMLFLQTYNVRDIKNILKGLLGFALYR
jgi:hypothetical protein